MNAISTRQTAALAMPEDQAIETLRASLYPGARIESVSMVLAWCRATGRDPMKKPVHIVPMWVKDAATGKGEMRDVIMPGIGTYRTDAARTGEYVGKSEPEFGPDVKEPVGTLSMTYPRWCKITVSRLVQGVERRFTATELWLENYATAGKDSANPNAMWKKRPYAQLAKCAEAQALRMAFPDETGNTNTMEEMEGKTFDGVTIDAAPPASQPQKIVHRPNLRQEIDAVLDNDQIPDWDAPKPDHLRKVADRIKLRLTEARDQDAYNAIMQHAAIQAEWDRIKRERPELAAEIEKTRQASLDAIADSHQPEASDFADQEA